MTVSPQLSVSALTLRYFLAIFRFEPHRNGISFGVYALFCWG